MPDRLACLPCEGYMAFFALMLSIGYEVEVSPPEGTQVYSGPSETRLKVNFDVCASVLSPTVPSKNLKD